jgi:hypothetical protein
MLYSMRSALCKSQAGDDFCSGILRSSGGDFAAQVKASVAPGHSPALGALVGFCFADEVLGCSMVFRSRQIVTFCFASPFVVAVICLVSVYHRPGSENLDLHAAFCRW